MLELVELAAVHEPRNHFLDVIGRAHVLGDEGVEVLGIELRRARVLQRHVLRRAGVRAQVAYDITHDRERVLVVLGQVIDHARFLRMKIPAAKVFGADLLARRRLHQRRAGEEDGALITHDHRLVGHGRDVSAARSTAPHDAGDLRDAERGHIGLIEEDAPEMVAVGEHLGLMRQVRTARVHQIDARQAVLLRDLLRAQVLLDRHRVVGATLHGRVVAHDHALPPRDAPHAGDDRGAVDVALIHPVRRQLADLKEGRTRIEQPLHPLAGEQLAARNMPLAVLLRPAERGLGHAGAQFLREGMVVREAGLGLRRLAVELGGERGGSHEKACPSRNSISPMQSIRPPASTNSAGVISCDTAI